MAEVTFEKKVKRHWERVKADHIVAFMRDTGINKTELAKAMGTQGGSIGHWINRNNAPKWTLLAIEALKRRTQGSSAFEAEKIAALEEEIKQLKDGQTVETGAAQRPEGKQYIPQIEEMILQLMDLKYDLKYGRHVEPG